eukprot:ANDGO_00716.mRNA.1 hypothetical protein
MNNQSDIVDTNQFRLRLASLRLRVLQSKVHESCASSTRPQAVSFQAAGTQQRPFEARIFGPQGSMHDEQQHSRRIQTQQLMSVLQSQHEALRSMMAERQKLRETLIKMAEEELEEEPESESQLRQQEMLPQHHTLGDARQAILSTARRRSSSREPDFAPDWFENFERKIDRLLRAKERENSVHNESTREPARGAASGLRRVRGYGPENTSDALENTDIQSKLLQDLVQQNIETQKFLMEQQRSLIDGGCREAQKNNRFTRPGSPSESENDIHTENYMPHRIGVNEKTSNSNSNSNNRDADEKGRTETLQDRRQSFAKPSSRMQALELDSKKSAPGDFLNSSDDDEGTDSSDREEEDSDLKAARERLKAKLAALEGSSTAKAHTPLRKLRIRVWYVLFAFILRKLLKQRKEDAGRSSTEMTAYLDSFLRASEFLTRRAVKIPFVSVIQESKMELDIIKPGEKSGEEWSSVLKSEKETQVRIMKLKVKAKGILDALTEHWILPWVYLRFHPDKRQPVFSDDEQDDAAASAAPSARNSVNQSVYSLKKQEQDASSFALFLQSSRRHMDDESVKSHLALIRFFRDYLSPGNSFPKGWYAPQESKFMSFSPDDNAAPLSISVEGVFIQVAHFIFFRVLIARVLLPSSSAVVSGSSAFNYSGNKKAARNFLVISSLLYEIVIQALVRGCRIMRSDAVYAPVENQLLPDGIRKALANAVFGSWMQDTSASVFRFLCDFVLLVLCKRKGEGLWRKLSFRSSVLETSASGPASSAEDLSWSSSIWSFFVALIEDGTWKKHRKENRMDAQRKAYQSQVQEIRKVLQDWLAVQHATDARGPMRS